MNFLNILSIYSLVLLVISQISSSTTYDIVNNVTHLPGGARFDREIGAQATIEMLKFINKYIFQILNQPNPSDRRDQPHINVYITTLKDAAGQTDGKNVYVDAGFIESIAPGPAIAKWELASLLFHEMTHLFQWFGAGDHIAPGGVTEGVAEYVRIMSGYYDRNRLRPGIGERWDEGYAVTAQFFMYCDGLRKGFTADFNNKMRFDYSEHFFVELLGKSLEELWRDYKAKYNGI